MSSKIGPFKSIINTVTAKHTKLKTFHYWNRLPEKAQALVLSQLSADELLGSIRTCKHFQKIISSNFMWTPFVRNKDVTFNSVKVVSIKDRLIVYTRIFLKLFPTTRLPKGNRSFEKQWNAICALPKTTLQAKLLNRYTLIELTKLQIQVLCDLGAPINLECMNLAFKHNVDASDIYLQSGYSITHQDIVNIFKLQDRAILYYLNRLKELEYKFTHADLKVALEKEDLSFLDLMIADFKGDDEDIRWSLEYTSYPVSVDYGQLSPKVLRKMVDLRNNKPLTLELFQFALSKYFSPNIVDIFLKNGYVVTQVDFNHVVDALIEERKKDPEDWRFLCKFSDPDDNVLVQFISKKVSISQFVSISRHGEYLGGRYRVTREDFRRLVFELPNMFNVALHEGYRVSKEEFREVIDSKVNAFEIMRSFLNYGLLNGQKLYESGGYLPTPEDLRYALERQVSRHVIRIILNRQGKRAPPKEDMEVVHDKTYAAELQKEFS